MSDPTKTGPASIAKTFSFCHQPYVLPNIKAVDLKKVQPDDLLAKLKASNSRLPSQGTHVAFLSAAFEVLLSRSHVLLSKAERRQAKNQWKASFHAYKTGVKMKKKKKKSSTPEIQQNVQTRGRESIVIDAQNWWISTRYGRDVRTLGFQNFGSKFMSINKNRPPQDFTPHILVEAFEAYITRCPNISSEIRQEVIKRKNSKRARRFLNKCARLAAEAQARAEIKAANCSADSSSSDNETETDGAETQDATDSSVEDTEDDMPSVVPAADSSAASKSTGSETEVWNTVQSSSEEDESSSSTTTSSESEVETSEVVDESHKEMSDGSSYDSNYDKISIDKDRQDDTPSPRKRRRESTPPPSTHYVLGSHHIHTAGAKRLRVAEPPILGSSSPSTEQYGPGRDVFSALEEYLNICSDRYKLAVG